MTQYLVRYRRSTGDLLEFQDLGSDRTTAMERRFEEERAYKDDSDIEVVVLTASSREDLLRTHARYFKSVPELTAALAAALPSLQGAVTHPQLKGKVRAASQKRG